MDYTGGTDLLVHPLNQGRAGGDGPVTTVRHAARPLLTDPDHPRPKEMALLEKITAACPELTALTGLMRGFAALLKPAKGSDANSPNGSQRPTLSPCTTCTVSPTA
ncbi:hypothetical protein ACPXCP_26435 [Streptomyces sp. DT20]|uniref:hypothetical protein n=1 Tax=Streptomyces sp. DT20 TaxID=3416519 RepID=UPI003CE8CDD4